MAGNSASSQLTLNPYCLMCAKVCREISQDDLPKLVHIFSIPRSKEIKTGDELLEELRVLGKLSDSKVDLLIDALMEIGLNLPASYVTDYKKSHIGSGKLLEVRTADVEHIGK